MPTDPTAVRATPARSFDVSPPAPSRSWTTCVRTKPDVIYDPPDSSPARRRRRVSLGAGRLPGGARSAVRPAVLVEAAESLPIREQVSIARRIAEHVALAVSHQQLAEAVSRAAEAHARAEQLEARVRSLSDGAGLAQRLRSCDRAIARVDGGAEAATQVASTETTVLLTGESGTGKEVDRALRAPRLGAARVARSWP